ncbi:hypothetical protein EUGRSUZ_L01478 [Eucalyptus grandis]|uniref:Uncharacterized protein n=1 Tax=Eucalyptus grandis TaxID=71139 RepID=A0A058ZVB0_EUCGR|nr:hypothetical protein EUGRSUZ_L01478 [Eucalyptus grandis]
MHHRHSPCSPSWLLRCGFCVRALDFGAGFTVSFGRACPGFTGQREIGAPQPTAHGGSKSRLGRAVDGLHLRLKSRHLEQLLALQEQGFSCIFIYIIKWGKMGTMLILKSKKKKKKKKVKENQLYLFIQLICVNKLITH